MRNSARKYLSRTIVAAAIVLAAMMGCPTNVLSVYPYPREGTKMTCLEEIHITRDKNLFREWDSRGAKPQGASSVRAVQLDNDMEPLPALSRYAVDGKPLIAIDRKTREPVVSAGYFSPLVRVDATRMEPGQERPIGKLIRLPEPLTYRDVAIFLLESQVINTYWHIGSDLCLVSENDSDGEYRARFQGSHVYFTNSRNEEKLDFSIVIDKKSGDMRLVYGR